MSYFLFFLSTLMYMLSFLSVGLSSLFYLWILMELVLFLFLASVCVSNYAHYISSKLLGYYSFHSFLSLLILFMLAMESAVFSSALWNLVISMILLIKIGLPPFHFWLVSMLESMDWMAMYHFLGVVKLPSLVLLSKIFVYTDMVYYFFLLSLLSSLVESFESSSFKSVFFYSSNMNLIWLFSIGLFVAHKNLMLFYFLGYLWNLLPLVMFFFVGSLTMSSVQKEQEKMKFYYFFLVLAFMGVPPFMMFFLKIFGFFSLYEGGLYMLMFFLLISSVFLMFVYFKVMIYLVVSKKFFFHIFFGKRFFLVKYLYISFILGGGFLFFM